MALLVLFGSMLASALAAAQADLAKTLVGTWEGELQMRFKKSGDPVLTLRIASVRQQDGKWIAAGRFGVGGKTRPVKIDVDPSGAKPSLRWTGASGATYDLNLVDDKHLVGTTMMTTAQAGSGDRERAVRLEKKE